MPISFNLNLSDRRKRQQLQDQLSSLQQTAFGQEAAGPPFQGVFPTQGGALPASPQNQFISQLLESPMTAERGITETIRLLQEKAVTQQAEQQQQALLGATQQAAMTDPAIAKIAPFVGLLGGEATKALGLAIKPETKTSLQKNLKAFGVDIKTPEGQKIGLDIMSKPAVQINQAPDLPTNFMWKDPNTRAEVMPIPGGPADPEIKSFNDRSKKLRESNLKIGQVEQSLNNYRGMINKLGTRIVPGAEKSALQTAYTDVLLEMKELYNLGVLNGPDLMLMQKTISDPSSVISNVLGRGVLAGQLDIIDAKIAAARERADKVYGNTVPTTQLPPATIPDLPPGFEIEQ